MENFVDSAIENLGEKWASDLHRKVAVICLIQNPRVFTMEKLMRNIKIINGISTDRIGGIDIHGLVEEGCDFWP